MQVKIFASSFKRAWISHEFSTQKQVSHTFWKEDELLEAASYVTPTK